MVILIDTADEVGRGGEREEGGGRGVSVSARVSPIALCQRGSLSELWSSPCKKEFVCVLKRGRGEKEDKGEGREEKTTTTTKKKKKKIKEQKTKQKTTNRQTTINTKKNQYGGSALIHLLANR